MLVRLDEMVSKGGIVSLAGVESLSHLIHYSSQRWTPQLVERRSTRREPCSVVHYFNDVGLDLLPELRTGKERWIEHYGVIVFRIADLERQIDPCQLHRNSFMLQLPLVVLPILSLLAF